jgi:hypothetical protein
MTNLIPGAWYSGQYSFPDANNLVLGQTYIFRYLYTGGAEIYSGGPSPRHGFLTDFLAGSVVLVSDTAKNFSDLPDMALYPSYPFPTVLRPLIVVHRGTTPSMKNENIVYLDEATGKPRFKRSPRTRRWLRGFRQKTIIRRDLMGFEIVPEHLPVSLVVIANLATQDADNVFTTVQEAMQQSAMEDDQQVKATRCLVRVAPDKKLEFVIAFFWTLPLSVLTDKDVAEEEHFIWYNKFYKGRSLSNLVREYA